MIPCYECGCSMEVVEESEVEDGELFFIETTYECPCCGNAEVRLDAG